MSRNPQVKTTVLVVVKLAILVCGAKHVSSARFFSDGLTPPISITWAKLPHFKTRAQWFPCCGKPYIWGRPPPWYRLQTVGDLRWWQHMTTKPWKIPRVDGLICWGRWGLYSSIGLLMFIDVYSDNPNRLFPNQPVQLDGIGVFFIAQPDGTWTRKSSRDWVLLGNSLGTLYTFARNMGIYIYISGWWFGTFGLCFHSVGKNQPNLLSYFSEGLKPPTRYIYIYV